MDVTWESNIKVKMKTSIYVPVDIVSPLLKKALKGGESKTITVMRNGSIKIYSC